MDFQHCAIFSLVTPRTSPSKRRPSKLRKRYGKALAPIKIDLADPRNAKPRSAFAEEPLSVEDSETVLRWLDDGGKGRPP